MKGRLKQLILSSRFLSDLVLRFYRWYLAFKNDITLGKKVRIGLSSTFEGSNYFGDFSTFMSSYLGFGSYISESSSFHKTRIGRYCSIGPNVRCVYGRHPSHTFVSTHPSFFSLREQVGFIYAKEQRFKEFADPVIPDSHYTIAIGNDVWIGANVTIMDGVTIGDGAIVAANALVNKNLEPYTIYAGIPARPIKKRFEPDQISFLLELKWWDQPKEWISKFADCFDDVAVLKSKFENHEPV